MKKVALAAASALALMAGSAQAAIVTYTTSIPVTADVEGTYINLGTGTFGGTPVSGWDINPYSAGGIVAFYWGGDAGQIGAGVDNGAGVYQDLAAGTVISAASSFSQSAQTTATINFRSSGTHTLGFRFLNEATNATNYGYLTVQTTGPNGFPATVLGWSYEITGAAITVAAVNGAVPEPATWGLMLLGFAMVGIGLRARRRSTTVTFA